MDITTQSVTAIASFILTSQNAHHVPHGSGGFRGGSSIGFHGAPLWAGPWNPPCLGIELGNQLLGVAHLSMPQQRSLLK